MALSENPAKTPQPGKGLRRALYVSVAVNLLVVGAIVGMLVAHGGRYGRDHGGRGVGFGRYTAALSPEDREALRAAYRAEIGKTLRADGADPAGDGPRAYFRAERAGLLAALRADPFDPATVQAAFERQKMRMTSGISLGQALLLQRISAMSPAERAAFSARIEAGPDRDKDRGRDHHRDDR